MSAGSRGGAAREPGAGRLRALLVRELREVEAELLAVAPEADSAAAKDDAAAARRQAQWEALGERRLAIAVALAMLSRGEIGEGEDDATAIARAGVRVRMLRAERQAARDALERARSLEQKEALERSIADTFAQEREAPREGQERARRAKAGPGSAASPAASAAAAVGRAGILGILGNQGGQTADLLPVPSEQAPPEPLPAPPPAFAPSSPSPPPGPAPRAAVVQHAPPPAGLMAAVQGQLGEMLRCLPVELRRTGGVQLSVQARLGGEGALHEPRVLASEEIAPSVQSCIEDALRALRAPPEGGGGRVVSFSLWLGEDQ
ncbi:MAG: hypothetical protein HY744_13170 [Deltaproteobacteria bacterium]|nr:hypothetical protein [Deltaproteobacteria bacterium]